MASHQEADLARPLAMYHSACYSIAQSSLTYKCCVGISSQASLHGHCRRITSYVTCCLTHGEYYGKMVMQQPYYVLRNNS